MKTKSSFILILIGIILCFIISIIFLTIGIIFNKQINEGQLDEFFEKANNEQKEMQEIFFKDLNLTKKEEEILYNQDIKKQFNILTLFLIITSVIGIIISFIIGFLLYRIKKKETKKDYIIITILSVIGFIIGGIGMVFSILLLIIGGIIGIVKLKDETN
ncbi:MAG: hypothetical protein ACLFPJ_01630 [Candidatus Woesearchaeota archaeon]